MSDEQKSNGWKKWVVVLLLLGVAWLIYKFPARDHSIAFRRAVYRGDLNLVEQTLLAHPEMVNATNSILRNVSPQSGNQSMNFMDQVTVSLFENMTGAKVSRNGNYDEFDSIEQSGMAPLHIAVSKGDEAMTELLLKHGANVAARDRIGTTALHMAAMRKASLIRLLLAYKAQPDSTNKYSHTPLIYSVSQKDPAMTELLLKAGANPNAVAVSGSTPLHGAAGNRSTNALVLLLQYGARMDVTNSRGQTPLDVARERRSTNVIRLLSPTNP